MSNDPTVTELARALATGLILSRYGLAFLVLAAGVAWAWTRFRQSHINATPGTAAAAKRFFATWTVLVVAGGLGFAVWVVTTATSLVESWRSIDGCFNC